MSADKSYFLIIDMITINGVDTLKLPTNRECYNRLKTQLKSGADRLVFTAIDKDGEPKGDPMYINIGSPSVIFVRTDVVDAPKHGLILPDSADKSNLIKVN